MSTANTLFIVLVQKKFQRTLTNSYRRASPARLTRPRAKIKSIRQEAVKAMGLKNTQSPSIDTINGD